jgi:c-di-GMP-binding flagellar brake protein YcgR
VPEQDTPFVFPVEDQSTIVIAIAVLLALLVFAILWEVIRRHLDRRRRKNTAWRMVKDIADEKELDSQEWRLLRDLIDHYGSRDPLRVVTVRQQFNQCVEAEMAALEHAPAQYDEMGTQLRSLRNHLGLDYIPFGQRIQTTRELYVGQLLWVMPVDSARGDGHRLQVAGVDEARFFARPQPGQGTPPAWEVGTQYRFRMWREEDARYMFASRLLDIEEGPRTLAFRHTTELQRMQARAHFRIRYDQETVVSVIDAPVDGDLTTLVGRTPIAKYRGRITSLSAGGCAVVIPQLLPRSVFLRLTVELPDADPIEIHARVVATSAISGGRQLVRATFADLKENERDVIARFVLHRQQSLTSNAENAE